MFNFKMKILSVTLTCRSRAGKRVALLKIALFISTCCNNSLLLLIQEGQLSVSGERMCTILVNCLED